MGRRWDICEMNGNVDKSFAEGIEKRGLQKISNFLNQV